MNHILKTTDNMDDFDRSLLAAVRPLDWSNPTPSGRYNLAVIGGGTAGLVTAAGAAGLGAKVALIEQRLLGGDCLNFGCVPSKALIGSSRIAAAARDSTEFGLDIPGGYRVDFSRVMERMRRIRSDLSVHDSAARFRDLGVDVFLGAGRFTGRDSIDVEGATLRFQKAVIATGARAATPAIPGIVDTEYHTNETIFSLTDLPARIGVLGAGPIGCELAQVFARFGSRVILLQKADRILPRDDREAALIVERSLERDGIDIIKNARVNSARRSDTAKSLAITTDQGIREIEIDLILAGVGRLPNVEGLDLEAAGVAYDRNGVTVDDCLRTTNPRIYAAGDICSKYQFTHAADATARVAIRNALFWGRSRASSLVIPWCTYTDPEIAHVGLGETDAKERGISIHTFIQEFSSVDRAVLDGETEGFVKVHVRAGRDEIVGATVVGRGAGELIGELAAAIANRTGLVGLGGAIRPYPTRGEAIRKIADQYNRTRLTPIIKNILTRWLRTTRGFH